MAPGKAVLLNGPPACGKTSLAHALQEHMLADYGQRWLALHVDEFMSMSMSAFLGKDSGIWHERLDADHVALCFDEEKRGHWPTLCCSARGHV